MAEEYFPFDAGPGADSTETRWRRMARLWAPSGVVGVAGSTAYNLAITGLTATLTRASTGFAEAWVDGHMHRLVTADWSQAVIANANASPRVDRLVLRLDATANTVIIARLAGTPAASPAAPALTQNDNGIWEIPLWSFTVPANSAAPLDNPVDERIWIDPSGNGGPRGIVAYGSQTASQGIATLSTARLLGGLNVTPYLSPGRFYELEVRGIASPTINASVRALLGSTPTSSTGTQVASSSSAVENPWTGKFTVASSGFYTLSPFAQNTSSSSPSSAGANSTLVLRDAGPTTGFVGTTPPVVP